MSENLNSEQESLSPDEATTYRISVVVKGSDRKFHDFHVDLKTNRELAVALQNKIAKVGFTNAGIRYFPDQIETLMLYKVDANGTIIDA